MAGVGDERLADSVFQTLQSRLPWLVVNLRMGALSAGWDMQWLGYAIPDRTVEDSSNNDGRVLRAVGYAVWNAF